MINDPQRPPWYSYPGPVNPPWKSSRPIIIPIQIRPPIGRLPWGPGPVHPPWTPGPRHSPWGPGTGKPPWM
jgi:hypothetical protein